jgi:quinoprotein glucose dehydrogenase
MKRVVRFIASSTVFRAAIALGLALLPTLAARPQASAGPSLVAVPPVVASTRAAAAPGVAPSDWVAYGRDAGGTRYSPLTQITPRNVGRLKVAWVFHTRDVTHMLSGSSFEATPIMVAGTLYLVSPFGRVFALDPQTGKQRWVYDPKVKLRTLVAIIGFIQRGLATWVDPLRPAGQRCHRRIFLATLDARLIALDARTGRPCADFGKQGQVDLLPGVGAVGLPGSYGETAPPTIDDVDGLVIIGGEIADDISASMPSGVVRAFDARSGALRWSFDPVPRNPNDPAYKTWAGNSTAFVGAGGVWNVMAFDHTRDLVFLPTEAASPDAYGGDRIGSDVYANSLVALHAATGKLAWYFQVVHHDVWDYDIAAQPALVTVRRGGAAIAAVAVSTKMGHIFFLNRDTGQPVFPVQERPVPQGGVPGEQTWPTQPFPTAPPPLTPERLSANEAFGVTPADREFCRMQIASLRSEGIFTPPSLQGSVDFPSPSGGVNWGSAAYNPSAGLLFVIVNRLAFALKLIPRMEWNGLVSRFAEGRAGVGSGLMDGTPYVVVRYPLWTTRRIPCNPPPWGTLDAIDVNSGTVRWQVPIGIMPAVSAHPHAARWGAISYGGPMVTGGRLVFAAGTPNPFLRAFNLATGKELWRGKLPVPAQSTPMTYSSGGKQFVVVAAGGSSQLGTPLGDSLVAFALP